MGKSAAYGTEQDVAIYILSLDPLVFAVAQFVNKVYATPCHIQLANLWVNIKFACAILIENKIFERGMEC